FSLALQGCSPAADTNYQLESVVEGITVPWSMVWLPEGDMLVSERNAKLYRVREGAIAAEISGLPKIHVNGQGGLLDLALHPRYGESEDYNWLYFTYSDPSHGASYSDPSRSSGADSSGDDKGSNTTLARAKLKGGALTEL